MSDGCRADPRRREEARTDCTVVPTRCCRSMPRVVCCPVIDGRRLIIPRNPKSGPHRNLCTYRYRTYRNNLLRVFFNNMCMMIFLAWWFSIFPMSVIGKGLASKHVLLLLITALPNGPGLHLLTDSYSPPRRRSSIDERPSNLFNNAHLPNPLPMAFQNLRQFFVFLRSDPVYNISVHLHVKNPSLPPPNTNPNSLFIKRSSNNFSSLLSEA